MWDMAVTATSEVCEDIGHLLYVGRVFGNKMKRSEKLLHAQLTKYLCIYNNNNNILLYYTIYVYIYIYTVHNINIYNIIIIIL